MILDPTLPALFVAANTPSEPSSVYKIRADTLTVYGLTRLRSRGGVPLACDPVSLHVMSLPLGRSDSQSRTGGSAGGPRGPQKVVYKTLGGGRRLGQGSLAGPLINDSEFRCRRSQHFGGGFASNPRSMRMFLKPLVALIPKIPFLLFSEVLGPGFVSVAHRFGSSTFLAAVPGNLPLHRVLCDPPAPWPCATLPPSDVVEGSPCTVACLGVEGTTLSEAHRAQWAVDATRAAAACGGNETGIPPPHPLSHPWAGGPLHSRGGGGSKPVRIGGGGRRK